MPISDRSVEARSPFAPAPAVRRGDLIFVGGTTALGEDGRALHPGDVRAQARAVFDRLEVLLTRHGGSLADVVSLTSFHADIRTVMDVFEVGREVFPSDPPAWTQAGFIGCQHVGALLMVRATAHVGTGERQSIVPDSHAWMHDLPIAAACRKGDLVFLAGQTAIDPAGNVAHPLDHCEQARGAYDRMFEILELCGGSFDDVLDFTSFHLDIRGAEATLEDVYFPHVLGPVAREHAATTVHVGATGLIRPDLLGVYTAIADIGGGERIGSAPEIITWNDNGNYPIAGAARKRDGKLITVAGQVSSGPDGNVMYPGDPDRQLGFIFEEIRASVEELGGSLANVTEICSFHKDPRSWDAAMRVASDFLNPDAPPAWTFVGSPGLWLEGYQHEIAAYAVLD